MKNIEAYEKVCLEIISTAGTAKSCFLEAIECAKAGGDVSAMIEEGEEAFCMASSAHARALQMDADGELDMGLLLIHAETILNSAEIIKDLSGVIMELLAKGLDKAGVPL